ncbi:MAG: hypothetical protein AAFU61_18100, partial [Pseudomonadota bacterium]
MEQVDAAARAAYNFGRSLYLAGSFERAADLLYEAVGRCDELAQLQVDMHDSTEDKAAADELQREGFKADALFLLGSAYLELDDVEASGAAYHKALRGFERCVDLAGTETARWEAEQGAAETRSLLSDLGALEHASEPAEEEA